MVLTLVFPCCLCLVTIQSPPSVYACVCWMGGGYVLMQQLKSVWEPPSPLHFPSSFCKSPCPFSPSLLFPLPSSPSPPPCHSHLFFIFLPLLLLSSFFSPSLPLSLPSAHAWLFMTEELKIAPGIPASIYKQKTGMYAHTRSKIPHNFCPSSFRSHTM